ncbi:MAG: endonuclease/exonuclease/phosphatase family protein [Myxococcales bacterium]|nr:endonuclease/exonuclease/phosphatase family protein [Myxococcales bacterium]
MTRRRARLLFAIVLGLFAIHAMCDAPPPPRVASLHIEGYPRSRAQIAGVFQQIKASGAQIVALQGVRTPRKVATAAGWRLGDSWRYVYPRVRGAARSLGVLYNDGELALRATRVHDSVAVTDGARPAFEARFVPRRRGAALRVLVVDLERDAGARTMQLRVLAELYSELARSGERVLLVGNFHSDGSTDRGALEALARASRARWLSREVSCTAYRRDDAGRCRGVALDHAFSVGAAKSVQALGPCAKVGCSPERCPRSVERVSAHCPLVVELLP